MKNWMLSLIATSSILAFAGCSMCCGTYDNHYPTYGGATQRMDRESGRVGSRFSDPNFAYSNESADSNLDSYDSKELNRSLGDEIDGPANEGELPPRDPNRNQPLESGDDTTASQDGWRNRPLRGGYDQWR